MTPGVDVLGAAGFAFGAGVATFFSPCAYPLLPGYVGYYASRASDGPEDAPLGGAVVRGLAACAGVLAVFAVLLVALVGLGQSVVSRVALVEPVIGLAFVVVGALTLADRMPTVDVALPRRRSTVLGFVAFGAVYAVAAAGCVLPIFAGVLLQALSLSATGSVAVVGSYALGMGALMVGVTVVTALGVDVGTGVVRYVGPVVRLSGAVMVLAGLGQLYLSVVVLGVV